MALKKSLQAIVNQKNQRLEDIPNNLSNKVLKVQQGLFVEITSLINQLEVSAGALVMSEENLLRVETIIVQLQDFLPETGYNEALTVFAREFDVQQGLNDGYFKGLDVDVPDTDLTRINKRNTIRKLIQGSLEAPFYNPIRDSLSDAVANGSSLRDTIGNLRTLIEGDEERLGQLDRYVKQISVDSFAQADRSYTQAIGIDLEWFFYSGGLVSDSRAFCQCRNGGWFHRQEVVDWGIGINIEIKGCKPRNTKGKPTAVGVDWQGKNPLTNETTIFTLLGGFNCLHSLMPGTLAVVPKKDVQRNIDNGNFVPTAFEREFLGI